MFPLILVANRGEVAARVARTCRRIGADTMCVHAEGEEESAHVQACDGTVTLTGRTLAETYANVRAVIAAALQTKCAALHPGYGVSDDDPRLSRECELAEIAFIGPRPDELVLFRDRVSIRNAAFDAGLRILEGSSRPCRDDAELCADVEALGLPLMIKPAFGIGEAPALAILSSSADLDRFRSEHEWEGAAVYVERWVDRPRHVEVQVAADGAGLAVALADREVSVRKDHRRVIAESPAPAIETLHRGDAVRSALWAAALDFVLSLRFRGVGSAHFMFDAYGQFSFVGWNPTLQPEHAVIEACTNLDLVETQVRLAYGEPLPREVVHAEPTGHAVQARIEAALDPRDGRPFPARVEDVRWPPAPTGKVRIETALQPQARIEAEHDPLVASITTYSATRHEAVLLLDRIVAETRIAPLVTNLRLLRRALNHESFRALQVDEGFLDRVSSQPG